MSLEMERLAVRGRLAEAEQRARGLEVSIQGDVNAVRTLLAPFAPVAELHAEEAAVQCVEMAAKHAEYKGLLAEIEAMRKALG